MAAPSATSAVTVPAFYDMRSDLHHFERSVLTLGRAYLSDHDRLRAEIKLWDLLYDLAAYGRSPTMRRHPSLEKALTLIDARLGESISVNALAREVAVSRNHLTRLFHQEKGLTVVAYIRQQRARRAQHLLEHTTLSLNFIAEQINAPNLQSFSALVKKETGHAPTHWRRRRLDTSGAEPRR